MNKYEYKCVSIIGGIEKTTSILNKSGQKGWELVAVVWLWHYFKNRLHICSPL